MVILCMGCGFLWIALSVASNHMNGCLNLILETFRIKHCNIIDST